MRGDNDRSGIKAQSSMVHVVYVLDEAYVDCTLVSIFSLLRKCTSLITISVIITDEIPRLKGKLDGLSRHFPKARLKIIEFKPPDVELPKETRFPMAAYGRMYLPKIFTGRVLYLDGDTLIRKDISKLFFSDLDDQAVGVCLDQAIRREKKYFDKYGAFRTKGIGPAVGIINDFLDLERYFNSGVLLMDTDKIRKLGLEDEMSDMDGALQFGRSRDLGGYDQEWLNHALEGNTKILPATWNSLWYGNKTGKSPFPKEERAYFSEARTNPGLVHYIGTKPWQAKRLWAHPKRRKIVNEYNQFCVDFRALGV